MLSDTTGIVHFVASIISLIAGTLVLAGKKGSRLHVQVGYVYVVAMLVVLITSFMTYKLHGRFGVLHWFAVISSVTLLAGMVPMFTNYWKEPLSIHLAFMYWSVIGLYCAFCAEVFTRLPFLLQLNESLWSVFYTMVGVGTALVGGIGSYFFRRKKAKWTSLVAGWKAKKSH